MKSPVQWCFNLTEIHEVMECITAALLHEERLCDWKRRLRDARDKLAHALEAFTVEAMEVTHEREYLAMFDALGYLTDATRDVAVNPRLLQAAFDELQEVFTLEVETA